MRKLGTKKEEGGTQKKGSSLKAFSPTKIAKTAELTRRLREVLLKPASCMKITQALAKEFGLEVGKATVADVLVHNLVTQALTDKPLFLMELLNRMEGKVADKVQVSKGPLDEMSDEELDNLLAGSVTRERRHGVG